MHQVTQEHLEEAMALFTRYLKTYSAPERNLAQAAIETDVRISKFHEEFKGSADIGQIKSERSKFLHIGFMLAADPSPEDSVLKADSFFENVKASELQMSEKTYLNAVIALQEYAAKLASGDYKVTIN